MTWAHPAALWLLAAASLPILLHLLGRARPRVLVFPGSFLLREVHARRRALRLRYLLLLLLRMLAVAAAAAAVAGPTISRPLPFLARTGDITVYVDRSASMFLGDAGPARRASTALQQLRAASPGPLRVVVLPPQSAPPRSLPRSASLADAAAADPAAIVLTDMDRAAVLPRRWPPRTSHSRLTIIDCGPPSSALIWDARATPPSPPAGAPVFVVAAGRAARAPVGVRLGDKPVASLQHRSAGLVGSLRLATPGPAPLKVGARPEFTVLVNVRPSLRVRLVAAGPSAGYLRAALDPFGRGRPFHVAATPADVVVASSRAAPPDGLRDAALVLFMGPGGHSRRWTAAVERCGWPPIRVLAGPPPARPQRMLLAPDCPPSLRLVLADFREALASADVRAPAALSAPGWKVVARFGNGAPAILCARRPRSAIVFAFDAEPAAASLVESGAFAALLHAAVLAVAPPPKQTAPASVSRRPSATVGENPPPVELAAPRASPADLAAAWATPPTVLPAGRAAEALRIASDLVPPLVLLLLAVLGAEWLIAARATASADSRKT